MASFVLVHGAFGGGWMWDEVAELLEAEGHAVSAVDLPSAGTDPATLGDLQADVAHVREVVERMEGPVVLVGHSAGGMVITELADHPGVCHSVYLSGLWPQVGQSVLDLLGGGPPLDWIIMRDDGTAQVSDDVEAVRQALCADLDAERAAQVHRRFALQSLASLASPSTAPNRGHPTTYIICEKDQAIPPAAQEAMAQQADRVVRLPTSHNPGLSVPEDVAAILGGVR